MHITCPHCNAAYEVGPVIKNALLVCYRCHAEFGIDKRQFEAREESSAATKQEESLPLFEHAENSTQGKSEEDEYSEKQLPDDPIPEPKAPRPEPEKVANRESESEGLNITAAASENDTNPLPPARKTAAIWPWLFFILLIIGGSGFWYKQDVWLDHAWVRSTLINMHLPVEVRDKDWQIVPESVHGQWLTRDDNSSILMIEGRVANRLFCELSPPMIQVNFFDDSGLDRILGETTLPITEPPSIEQVKHAPFEMPNIDRVPVEAQGERGFFLVIDSLPDRTADFTLTAVVIKR